MKQQNLKGFALIFEILLVLVVALAILLMFIKGPGQKLFSKDPACTTSSALTASPVELSQLTQVTPLGNINAPFGHIFPSDHIGLTIPRLSNEPNNFATVATNIISPGAIRIYDIGKTSYYKNGQLTQADYSINFSLCRNLEFYFGHVQHISSALEQAISKVKGECQGQIQGEQSYPRCEYHIDYTATQGEILGTAGGPGTTVAGVDFGAVDKNKPRLSFVRQKDVPDTTAYGQCPLNYFEKSLRDRLYDKLPTKSEPRCGQIMQDRPGTLQGDWYLQNKGSSRDWSTQFAMLHNNIDPTIGVVSIGGTIGPAGNFNFSPTHNGLVNREPSEVKSNGQVYCYYSDLSTGAMSGLGDTTGQVLLQLVDEKTLKAEHQDGNCGGHWSFSQPTSYSR
jgi:hypothetical protein